jgi:hypothetical protein
MEVEGHHGDERVQRSTTTIRTTETTRIVRWALNCEEVFSGYCSTLCLEIQKREAVILLDFTTLMNWSTHKV